MAIIAGTAYCISSFPIFSVPNAVGAFCPVIIPISFILGCKGTDFPISKQEKENKEIIATSKRNSFTPLRMYTLTLNFS